MKMKRMAVGIGALAVLVILSACEFGPWPVDDPVVLNDAPKVERISSPGVILRPLIGGGDDWAAIPFGRMLLLFATGHDQYGNPVGLSDDRVWSIVDVVIRCGLKGANDSVYNPGDSLQRHGFSADSIPNACVWYPLYTGGIDPISGYLFSPKPEVGYAFDSCLGLGTTEYPAQDATITARAHAQSVRIRISVPLHIGGTYTLDLPGTTPQSGAVFELAVGHSGPIDVVWEDGTDIEIHTVDVPEEWFWCSGAWTMEVMATGAC